MYQSGSVVIWRIYQHRWEFHPQPEKQSLKRPQRRMISHTVLPSVHVGNMKGLLCAPSTVLCCLWGSLQAIFPNSWSVMRVGGMIYSNSACVEKGASMSTLVVCWGLNGRDGRSATWKQDLGCGCSCNFFQRWCSFSPQNMVPQKGVPQSITPMWGILQLGPPQ